MENTAIRMMQELLSCGTDIPLWHYDTDGHLLYTNSEHLVLGKILDFIGGIRYMLEYAQQDRRPLILGSDMGLVWCAVFASEKDALQGCYVIGPVFHAEMSAAFIEDSVSRYHIGNTFRGQYLHIMKGISVVPSIMFMQYALMLHYCVTGTKLNRSDIQFQPRSELLSPVSQSNTQPEAVQRQHYLAEQALLRMVREGDRNYKQAIAQSHHLFGQLPSAQGESMRYATIRATGFTALCIQEAILAGVSPDTAHAVGDGYIESMLQCNTVSELRSMNLAMFEDFVYRVYKHRTNPKISTQIQHCRDYIELHAQQPLKLSQLAKQAGYSEYYLSRKFKKEMGLSIGTYIKYVRVEQSKLMLISTDMPIAQIADTLHFASSSHFSNAFREVTGKTPQLYRAEHKKI